MSRGQTATKSRAAAPSKGSAKSAASAKRPAVQGSGEGNGKWRPRPAPRPWPRRTKRRRSSPRRPRRRLPETTPDSPLPLLDLSDAAVKKMIKQAKKRGYVTHDQLNAVLPSEEVSSDQIEDVYAMLNEMGINVVDSDEAEQEEENKPAEEADDDDDSDGELVPVAKPRFPPRPRSRAVRAHRRSGADVSARDGLGRAALPRGRNRDRQAHRGRPRGDDRGPLRKPADLPGHHHLARRAERRKGVPARHHRSRSDLRRPRRQEQHGATASARRRERPTAPAAAERRRPFTVVQAPAASRRRAPLRPRRRQAQGRRRGGRRRRDAGRPTAISTTTTWRIRSRSPRSRPSSSRRCWRPSTTSPPTTSGCAACRTRTSRSS